MPDSGGVENEPVSFGDAWPLIQRLPVRQRAVIVLADHEDLPENRIAQLPEARAPFGYVRVGVRPLSPGAHTPGRTWRA